MRILLSNGAMGLHFKPTFKRSAFQCKMIHWFRKEQRDLPWRHTGDPYRIWISESMLQQTQVAAVLPYYREFLRRFPTVRRLATAPLSRVLASWAGLGYYIRARRLHRTAKLIVRNYSGRFPDRYEDLLSLPGIGRYTAGAILSIAFGKKFPVLDGNVERVLARIMAVRSDIKAPACQKFLWAMAEDLVPARAPSEFNQSMMELGAMVCLPRQPQCGRCPVQSFCRAHRLNLETSIPQIRQSPNTQQIHRVAAVIRDQRNRVLLWQRQGKTQLRGFWEFPHFDLGDRELNSQPERRNYAALLEKRLRASIGQGHRVSRSLCAFQHSITFRRIRLHAFEINLAEDSNLRHRENSAQRWVAVNHLKNHLYDSASLKILAAISKL